MLIKNRKVLVLNRSGSPVGVISLKKAIVLVCGFCSDGQPKARIFDGRDNTLYTWSEWTDEINAPEEGEDAIHSASRSIRVPEIVWLTQYDKLPQKFIRYSRKLIFKRDDYQCMYCGDKPGVKKLSIDHVVPRAKGGKTSCENCVTSCIECNSRKADRTMVEAGMRFFLTGFKPFKPKFTLYKGDFRYKSWSPFIGETVS